MPKRDRVEFVRVEEHAFNTADVRAFDDVGAVDLVAGAFVDR